MGPRSGQELPPATGSFLASPLQPCV